MIHINLLPGATRKSRGGRGVKLNVGALLTGAAARVKDPLLLSAVGSVVIAVIAIAGMFWLQGAQSAALAGEVRTAEQDSIRFAAVIREKHKTEAQRDSVTTQLQMISSIDGKRFVWAHVMDELSRALPAYTWITQIEQTNTTLPIQPVSKKPDEEKAGAAPKKNGLSEQELADSVAQTQRVDFRVVGNTVDIQALTRYMRLLEASAFIENVQLIKSALILVDGKEVTEFTLEASYQTPDPSAIHTVPLTIAVR
jgi:Tfp pilus assembly protein PilN